MSPENQTRCFLPTRAKLDQSVAPWSKRVGEDELPKRRRGDLEEIGVDRRANRGVSWCSSQQRHLPEESGRANPGHLLPLGLERYDHFPSPHHEHRRTDVALAHDDSAGAVRT